MAGPETLSFHPAANLFPLMPDEELAELAKDIAANGLRESIMLAADGSILDGRNRYRACMAAGITPRFAAYAGDDPLGYVVSLNLHRRHLTPTQRAMVAVDMLPLLEQQAKERQATSEPGVYGGKPLREKVPEAVNGKATEHAAAAVKVNPRYVSDAKRIVEKAPELVEPMRRGEVTLQQAKREVKEAERQERRHENHQDVATATDINLLRGQRFATLVLDPPWDWGDEGDQDQLGRARPTYATMPLAEIAALPIAEIADQDAHMYLWITNRSLPKGFALLDAWGFRYVTCLTWCKPSIGMGNYYRGSTEQVLFGIRGSQPLQRRDVGTWFAADRPGAHSAKPPEFYRLVQSCSPGPYLELFARQPRAGWTVWGAEAKA